MIRWVACFVALSLLGTPPAGAFETFPPAELMDQGANSLAVFGLRSRLATLSGPERDQTSYELGQACRRLGDQGGAEEALSKIPKGSPWYPRSIAELANLFSTQGKVVRAIEAYRALVPTLEGKAAREAQLRLGDELFFGRYYEDAVTALRPLEDAPEPTIRESALYGAGWAATRSGNHSRALWFWQQAIRQFPTSPRIREARLNLANHYLRLGRTALAADQLGAAGGVPGEDLPATAEFVAGEASADAGDWVRAIAHYKAVPKDSRWAEGAAYGVGWALWRAGRLPEAEDTLRTFGKIFPKAKLAVAGQYALGRLLEERGLGTEAAAVYRETVAAGRGRWAEEALFQLAAMALETGRRQDALTFALRLEKEYPQSRLATPGLWLIAEAQLESGAVTDAIASYGRLALRPESLEFLDGKGDRVVFKLGLAYFKAGDFGSAESAFRQVKGGFVAPEAAFWRGEALYRLGRFGEAADSYARVVEKFAQSAKAPEAAYGMGWSALRKGDKAGAIAAFRQATGGLLDPRLKRDAFHRLGLLLLDAGKYNDARRAFEQAIAVETAGDPVEEVFYLAYSNLKEGDLDAAVSGFGAIAERDGQSTRGRQARSFQGQALVRLGKHPEAGKLFEALADSSNLEEGERFDALMRGAAAYFAGSLPEKAAGLYSLVANDASSSADIRKAVQEPLAGAYLEAGLLSQAESVLTGAASGDAWVSPMLLDVARRYGKLGKWREAAATYKEFPGADRGVGWERARALRQSGDALAAADLYESLSAVADARRPLILLELADTYAELGLLEKDRKVLDRLELEKAADRERLSQAWFQYGELTFKKGNQIEAAHSFRSSERHAAKGSVGGLKARYWLGSSLVDGKRYEDALTELARVVAEPQRDDPAFRAVRALAVLKQGEALERLRRWDEALAEYQRMADDKRVPERERQEALARIAWIKLNVKRVIQP